MDWLIKLLLVAFAIWVVWSFIHLRYVIEIRIRNGRPQLRRGKVTASFLATIEEICREGRVDRGWIGGLRRGQRIGLVFSRHFPPHLRQRLRNEWQSSA
ncbi:MAG: DUF3634 family protein [Gemmataceae bacterium]